jgi:hypothetical protein
MSQKMSDPSFSVPKKEFMRLSYWFQFFPQKEATLADRVLAEKFYRGQFGPIMTPLHLDKEEVELVRLWFNYVSDAVLDQSDEDYAERLDEWLVRFS